MSVTVVICTWNRAALLDRTLEQVARIDLAGLDDWELLVVNNASTDDTADVLRRHTGRLPLRVLEEPRPGKPHAANLAIAQARHDLTAWTDDDVLVERGWLKAIVAAARQHPQAAYFGGPIDPLFSVEPPAWIRRHIGELRAPYAMLDLGPAIRPFAEHEIPFGANLGLRRTLLDDLRFDPRLGPAGDNQIRGEETALVRQLRARGAVGLWVGTARVQHYIPPARLTASYLRGYYHGLGRTDVRSAGYQTDRAWGGAPLWALRQYWQNQAARWAQAPFGGRGWVRAFRRAMITRGIIDECRAQRHARSVEALATHAARSTSLDGGQP